ncbi:DnaJ domain-containing protein [Rhizobium sp. CG5]|uniref:DnaJ C-terminal domain-containing protein n=1 Tax=Rhizobium sp. CG5 TaxID=2726076 RepID=UPI00203492BC|nr:DnaJ C-terminal domain-containing protein [Rhizobium sp. CG5]MCM2476911.1 DnaJ domain-containing protein [Rhizobium sp. CG5]
MRDPYSVLGVKRDAGADEIKAAWRNKAKSSHPDHNHDDPNATQRFAEVGQAYDVLKDPMKRTRYDEQRFKAEAKQREQTIMQQREAAREAAERAKVAKANAERILAELALAEAQKAKADKTAQTAQAYAKAQSGQAKPQPQQQQSQPGPAPAGDQQQQSQQSQTPLGAAPENPEDLISRIFGSSAQASAAAENLRREAEAKAATTAETATDENGAPLKPATPRIFAPIEIISSLVRRIRGTQPVLEKAPDMVVDSVIAIDDLLNQKSIGVQLPDGRDVRFWLEGGHTDGHVVRLKGQGLRLPGMQRGDVAVTLRVLKTDKFSVDGLDIHTVLPITLENAVLGCDTTIEGPSGPVDVKVPAWSGSDQVIRLEGLGLPGGQDSRGDLVIELRVVLWEKPDDKVTDLMRVMREGLFL